MQVAEQVRALPEFSRCRAGQGHVPWLPEACTELETGGFHYISGLNTVISFQNRRELHTDFPGRNSMRGTILQTLLQTLLMTLLLVCGTGVMAAEEELGCIRGDCENGEGVLVKETERGLTRYRGSFRNGEYNGYGRLTYIDENAVYKGYWKAGKKDGRGTHWDADNNVYIGQWRNDRRNGQGVQAFAVEGWTEDQHSEFWLTENTENYTGNFRNDVFYGQGTYRWADGTRYVGEWVANKKHGEGYFDYGFGNIARRIYEFDERVN